MTDICFHLADSGHLNQPFALVHTPDAHAFTCPACTLEFVEAMLDTASTKSIVDSLVFTRCDHQGGGSVCWPCVEAIKAQITLRWSALIHTDKRLANRFLRLRNAISKRYDRATVETDRKAKHIPKRTIPAYPGLRSKGAAGDRAVAGVRWNDAKEQRLSALVPPSESITVIAPVTQNIAW